MRFSDQAAAVTAPTSCSIPTRNGASPSPHPNLLPNPRPNRRPMARLTIPIRDQASPRRKRTSRDQTTPKKDRQTRKADEPPTPSDEVPMRPGVLHTSIGEVPTQPCEGPTRLGEGPIRHGAPPKLAGSPNGHRRGRLSAQGCYRDLRRRAGSAWRSSSRPLYRRARRVKTRPRMQRPSKHSFACGVLRALRHDPAPPRVAAQRR
jgi:hypothetical protein